MIFIKVKNPPLQFVIIYCISLQQQKQKRGICTWFPLLQTAISERQIPNVISTPAVTSNINGQPLPPQINHLDIPQNSPNVYNGVNALNSYCGNS
ncbi:unnamed protein product [Rhizophagus irregularis]|nr:unnamed protein product [Rhizophagus irregularis]